MKKHKRRKKINKKITSSPAMEEDERMKKTKMEE